MSRDESDDPPRRSGFPVWAMILIGVLVTMAVSGITAAVVVWVAVERRAQQQLQAEFARVDELRAYADAARREAEEFRGGEKTVATVGPATVEATAVGREMVRTKWQDSTFEYGPYLAVHLRITNTGDEFIRFNDFRGTGHTPTIRDERGREYAAYEATVGRLEGVAGPGNIGPGEAITTRIFVPNVPQTAERLDIAIPARAIGVTGDDFRFTLSLDEKK